MSYSQFAVFSPVPAAPVKSSLKTVVMPAGAVGTAASAWVVKTAVAAIRTVAVTAAKIGGTRFPARVAMGSPFRSREPGGIGRSRGMESGGRMVQAVKERESALSDCTPVAGACQPLALQLTLEGTTTPERLLQ